MNLKYIQDFRTLLFLSLILVLQGLAYSLSPLWLLVFAQPLLIFACAVAGAINHNHMHVGIFRQTRANVILNLVLSWAMGASSTQMTVTHVLIHHRHFRGEGDWTRYALTSGRGPKRIWFYLRSSIREIRKGRKSFLADGRNSRWRVRILVERGVLWVGSLGLLVLSPLHFILAYLLPWAGGLALVLVVNLLQHDELDLKTARHSRDFEGPIGNWLTFNAFIHTIHHEKPSLHWSQLPRAHRERGSRGERSFFVYLYRRYLQSPSESLNA